MPANNSQPLLCNIDFCLFQMVARHFKQIKVIEKDVLTYFIYAAKNHRGRLDSKQPGENVWSLYIWKLAMMKWINMWKNTSIEYVYNLLIVIFMSVCTCCRVRLTSDENILRGCCFKHNIPVF